MSELFQKNQIKKAADAIQKGELVAFPTETVYGLGADATNPEAVKKVYAAKGRPSDNPLIVHVTSSRQVEKYATIDEQSQQLMDKFWPGPLTIILPIKPNAFDPVVTGGLETVAFRNPETQITLDLIDLAGVPLVGPSANTSGKPSPTKSEHVMHDLDGKIAGVLEGGQTKIGVESTVIDMAGKIPTILRPGAVTEAQLSEVLGEIQTSHHKVGKDEVPKAPGMKYKHYAPNAQVYITQANDWKQVVDWTKMHLNDSIGLMATDSVIEKYHFKDFDNVSVISLGDDVITASQRLFDGLRSFDLSADIKVIFCQEFDNESIAEAYMNRLQKAAGNQYFKDIL